MTSLRTIVAGLLLAAGCAPAAEKEPANVPVAEPADELALVSLITAAPREGPVGRSIDARLPGEMRPELLANFGVDYTSLNFLESVPVSQGELSTFSVTTTDGSYRMRVPTGYLAQADVGAYKFASRASAADGRRASAPCRTAVSMDTTSATWEGISLTTWTDTELEYVRFEGSFDNAKCEAVATRAFRVKAKAIIPSVVYGFRECVGGCGKKGAEELLVVLGPPTQWLTSSAPWPADQVRVQGSAFSRTRVPMKKGGSASVSMNSTHAAVWEFVGEHRTVPEWSDSGQKLLAANRVLQLGVDTMWPEADAAPSSFVFVSSITPGSADFLETLGLKLARY